MLQLMLSELTLCLSPQCWTTFFIFVTTSEDTRFLSKLFLLEYQLINDASFSRIRNNGHFQSKKIKLHRPTRFSRSSTLHGQLRWLHFD